MEIVRTTTRPRSRRPLSEEQYRISRAPYDVWRMYDAYLDIAEMYIRRDPHSVRDHYQVTDREQIPRILLSFNKSIFRQLLIVHGPVGSGKSTMMRILHMMLGWGPVRWEMHEAADIISRCERYGMPEMHRRYRDALLVIDDFESDDHGIRIAKIISYRIEQGLPTIITSRRSASEVLSDVPMDVLSMTEIDDHCLDGPNYRIPLPTNEAL